MNALSDLTTEVKFRERMRGYDYEEVDSYVKTVSRVATQAGDRMAELENRLAQLESQTSNDDGGTEIRETLLRTLVLAQRTADSAVSEARSEAKSITDSAKERATKTVSEAETAANERLRSAEERAARMLAESEENGQIIVAEAKRTAAAELASERARAQAEIRDLETTRGELETVVAEIQARVDDERNMLRSLAVSFQSFVEKFEPVAGIEETAGELEAEAVEGAVALDADSAGSEMVAETVSTDGDAAETPEAPEAEEAPLDTAEDIHGDQTVEAGAGEPPGEGDPEPAGGPALEFLPAPDEAARKAEDAFQGVLASDSVDAGIVPELPVVQWDDEIRHDSLDDIETAEPDDAAADVVRSEPSAGGNGSPQLERPDFAISDEAASAGPATMPFGVDSPELFDMDAEEDDEFIEQLRKVVSSDAPLPDTDAAMAAFFEHDEGASPRRGASDHGGRLGPRA